MKKILLMIVSGVAIFLAGAAAAYLVIDRFYLYPMSAMVSTMGTDGVSVTVNYLDADKYFFLKWGDKVILDIWDWKNNGPKKRIIYTGGSVAYGQVRDFYGDEKMIMLKFSDDRLLVYHKFVATTEEIRASAGSFVMLTPDKKGFLSEDEQEGDYVYLLNWDGSVKDRISAPGSPYGMFNFSDDGKYLAILKPTFYDSQPRLFLYDTDTHKTKEIFDKKVGDTRIQKIRSLKVDKNNVSIVFETTSTKSGTVTIVVPKP